ncbi:hypothetical protein CPter291_2630 [Collimonas pratensis]|uniref:Uncharacterized protein n=1 Tax=Collimonas pratensis TaxID=279113 RepID=A0ABM5Z782_9BURK|nr:hypothetical protein CPter291_2630 [Collimonas pratensis]
MLIQFFIVSLAIHGPSRSNSVPKNSRNSGNSSNIQPPNKKAGVNRLLFFINPEMLFQPLHPEFHFHRISHELELNS